MSDPTEEGVDRAVKKLVDIWGVSEREVRRSVEQLLNAPKLSCIACVVNAFGWNAKHACGYPDDVAAASGIA